MTNCKYKLRKLSVGLVSVGTMFMTTTVMGEEVTQPTATVTTSRQETERAASTTTTVPENNQPEGVDSKDEESQTGEEKLLNVSSHDTSDTPSQNQSNSRSRRSVTDEVATQTMEVERFSIDTPITDKMVKDEKQQIATRDKSERRDLFKVERNVEVDEAKGEINVSLTVTPQEIDNGADVIVLLDTSKKMTESDFNTAKENITKLVNTLTAKNTDGTSNYNNRNSVRLIDFYREVGNPIDLSGLSKKEVEEKLQEVRKKAYGNWDWGVDLQGAIHKARDIFKRESTHFPSLKKRQHIVLFSQGEATFSYALTEKEKKETVRITEPVLASNPLFSVLPIFNHTNQNADMVDAAKYVVKLGKKLGIEGLDELDSKLKLAGTASGVVGFLTGGGSLTEYLTLRQYKTNTLSEQEFDYTDRIGEGYHHYTFSDRKTGQLPMKSVIEKELANMFNVDENTWFGWILDKISLSDTYKQTKQKALLKVLEDLFYKREYIYYNHNLSAQAEAAMARNEGIVFYSFDVTDPNRTTKEAKPNNYSKEYQEYLKKKAEEAKNTEKKRDEKFDKYLKEMSEGKNFLKDVDDRDKFKDILAEIKLTETFEKYVSVLKNSWQASLDSTDKKENKHQNINYIPASSGWFSSNESLTWTISKDELKSAFENEKPLTLTYTLKVNKENFNKPHGRRRRSTSEPENKAEKIISNTISYKINDKTANGNKLEDVKLTYTKEMVPVPEIDGEVIEPLAPQLPELPPITDYGPNLNFEEETIHQLPIEHGQYDDNTQTTLTEDTKPEKIDTIIGGNVIDFTEDSITHNQYTESGHNSTNENQEIIEDTKPESDTISIGGQSDPIEITEDTLSNQSGHSNEDTIIEDTKAPDIIIGGQDEMVTITQETQSGMSGFNEATVIEEDTRPKLQFHFENEEPTPTINQAVTQPSVAKVEDKLPQTGDNDKLEAFFTVTALTVIGTAGLLAKKRREDQID